MRSCSASLPAGLPAFRRQDDWDGSAPTTWPAVLPPGSAFVDIIRYRGYPGRRRGRAPICRVRPRAAEGSRFAPNWARPPRSTTPSSKWRDAVTDGTRTRRARSGAELEGRSDAEGVKLRRLVWEPIAAHLPPGTTLALPGARRRPGGPSLRRPPRARRLIRPWWTSTSSPAYRTARSSWRAWGGRRPRREAGPFPALGDVDYDPRYTASRASIGALRLAKQVAGTRPTITLQQRKATAGALCRALPRARDAIIETHAFYREDLRIAEQERRLAFVRDWPLSGGLSAPRTSWPRPRARPSCTRA